MPVVSVRISWKLYGIVKLVAEEYDINLSDVMREAVQTYLSSQKHGLERLGKEAEIDRLVKQLDFLDRTQRKMLRSGSFLAKSLPKHWSPAKRWSVAVTGEEREALELFLGERDYLAKQIAKLATQVYTRKGKIVLQDHPPWYRIVPDEASGTDES